MFHKNLFTHTNALSTRFCRVFHTHPILTGCGCSAMQQLKQTQNSVILRLTKKPQQFPLSAQTPFAECLPVRWRPEQKKKKTHTHWQGTERSQPAGLNPRGLLTQEASQRWGSALLFTEEEGDKKKQKTKKTQIIIFFLSLMLLYIKRTYFQVNLLRTWTGCLLTSPNTKCQDVALTGFSVTSMLLFSLSQVTLVSGASRERKKKLGQN